MAAKRHPLHAAVLRLAVGLLRLNAERSAACVLANAARKFDLTDIAMSVVEMDPQVGVADR